MWKPATGILLAALGCGIAIFLLRHGKPDDPVRTVPDAPTSTIAQTRVLNEVLVQVPTQVAAPVPATNVPVTPGEALVPLPLPPDFAPLLENSATARALHTAIERESREEPWATQMERKWQTAFAANPELLGYGTPDVHCRKTRCEVQLVTFSARKLDRLAWMQLISRGAGERDPGDTSPLLVRRVMNGMLNSIENDGATVILYSYEYEREPPLAP